MESNNKSIQVLPTKTKRRLRKKAVTIDRDTSPLSFALSDHKLIRLIIFLVVFSYCTTSILLFHLEKQDGITNVYNAMSENLDLDRNDGLTMDLSSGENKEKQDQHDASLPKLKHGRVHADGNADGNVKAGVDKTIQKGKEPIVRILKKSRLKVTPEIKQNLPTWEEVTSIYGSKPKIIGLETCSTFQSTIPESDAYIAPSGMFNTGTNLLAEVLWEYCALPKRTYSGPERTSEMKSGMVS